MMITVRRFALLVLVLVGLGACSSDSDKDKGFSLDDSDISSPYPDSELFSGLEFDWRTHNRLANGSDNWPTTWGGDDIIYTAWGDGGGFEGGNRISRTSIGIAIVEGNFDDYETTNILGGVGSPKRPNFVGKSYGILAVDPSLYMWVSPGDGSTLYFGSRLHVSEDDGVNWEILDWDFSRDTGMITPTFLQFGKGYEGARDEYVYIYANHLTSPDFTILSVQKPGETFLLRAPKDLLKDRKSYEFFTGLDKEGNAKWSSKVEKKVPVLKDPNGVGWNVSAFYHPAYKRYFILTEHEQSFRGCLGMFEGESPWGPWKTVHYQCGFGEGQILTSSFYWNVPTKWIDKNGQFTMVFTGIKENDSWNTIQARFLTR